MITARGNYTRGTIRVIEPPAVSPALLKDVKEWCRIDATNDSEDTTLKLLIDMAIGTAEDITGRAFVVRKLELNLPHFERVIELPWPPLIDVESVSYIDIQGATQIVDPATYEIDTVSEPGMIQPVWAQFWPAIVRYTFNPVKIVFRAGYIAPGSPPDLTDNSYLPPELRLWMQSRIASFYDNRAQYVIDTRLVDVQVPRDFADGLLDSLIVATRIF
jgi:uncharacterized phiE125 gp8 family phage protein